MHLLVGQVKVWFQNRRTKHKRVSTDGNEDGTANTSEEMDDLDCSSDVEDPIETDPQDHPPLSHYGAPDPHQSALFMNGTPPGGEMQTGLNSCRVSDGKSINLFEKYDSSSCHQNDIPAGVKIGSSYESSQHANNKMNGNIAALTDTKEIPQIKNNQNSTLKIKSSENLMEIDTSDKSNVLKLSVSSMIHSMVGPSSNTFQSLNSHPLSMPYSSLLGNLPSVAKTVDSPSVYPTAAVTQVKHCGSR